MRSSPPRLGTGRTLGMRESNQAGNQVYIYIYIYICIYVYVSLSLSIYIYIYIYVRRCAQGWTFRHARLCVYLCEAALELARAKQPSHPPQNFSPPLGQPYLQKSYHNAVTRLLSWTGRERFLDCGHLRCCHDA